MVKVLITVDYYYIESNERHLRIFSSKTMMETWLENIELTIRERKFLASLDYVLSNQQRKALGFSFTITRVEYATNVEASANLSCVKSKKRLLKKNMLPIF